MENFLNIGEKTNFMKVEADGGRIYLPKEDRKRYGNKFRKVNLEDGIMLIPISEDPLKRLRDITSSTGKSARDLREEARESMIEEADK